MTAAKKKEVAHNIASYAREIRAAMAALEVELKAVERLAAAGHCDYGDSGSVCDMQEKLVDAATSFRGVWSNSVNAILGTK